MAIGPELAATGRGTTFTELSASQMASLMVHVPQLDEQRVIADFLDREAVQIDTLIAKQQQLIATLRERRWTHVETELGPVVGRGQRLKWYFDEVDVRARDRASTLPLMSVSISWGVRRRDEVTDEQAKALDLSNYKVCEPGDIVLNRMRAFQGALGVAPARGIVSPDYSVLRATSGVVADWLSMVMRTQGFVGEMVGRLKGIGGTEGGSVRTPRINVTDLAEILIDLPTVAEQAAQVELMKFDERRVGALIGKAEEFISLVKERHAALITAAVTGQIDVTEAA